MANTLLPEWEMQGFAEPPEEHVSAGGEFLVRAYSPDAVKNRDSANSYAAKFTKLTEAERKVLAHGRGHGTSGILSNCFFVPAYHRMTGSIMPRAIDYAGWDGAFLEKHLSAFIFGNDYSALALYRMPRGLPYSIGTIAQFPRYISNGKIMQSELKSRPRPNSTAFRQVTLRPGSSAQLASLNLIQKVRILGLGPISQNVH